jgi:hypothetical protein
MRAVAVPRFVTLSIVDGTIGVTRPESPCEPRFLSIESLLVTDTEWIGSADRTSCRVLRVRADERAVSPPLRGPAANPAVPAETVLQFLQTHPMLFPLRRRAAPPALVLHATLRHPLRLKSYPRRPERCDIRA